MLTRVVIMRHAKPCNDGYPDDSLRPLSESGTATQVIMTEKLKEMGLVPDLILTSPFLRAVQTAEIVNDVNGGEIPIVETNSLGDSYDSQDLMSKIPLPEENKTVFIVGHAPTLTRLIFEMLGNFNSINALATSSATLIDFREAPAPGKGQFVDYYAP